MSNSWGFYGRTAELSRFREILARGRFFFARVAGRRRIGKTRLIREALRPEQQDRVLYIQVPDADPAGVVSTARDFMSMFGAPEPMPHDLRSLATRLGALIEAGWIVALDEFQYFSRRPLFEFTSQLQSEVDRLSALAPSLSGGLVVLGSIHTEMTALLDDRSAPLYNRTTDALELGHLDVQSLDELLAAHADPTPERLLFLWNLFEGVPKFYRDCFEQGVLGADRRVLLERMFFSSSSPLRNEADSWFLRELRGRYDLLLKYIASHPGSTNADIHAHVRSVEPDAAAQVSGYLQVLSERYGMIERLQPVFAKANARSGRFYLRDNFLRSWLSALAVPVASVSFRPIDALVAQADQRLFEAEGHGFERLVGQVYAELSRKGLGDFALTHSVRGWWDRSDTEIDLVALDELDRRIRLVTCKRSSSKLMGHLRLFDGHVERFLSASPRFHGWTVEKVAVAPTLAAREAAVIRAAGYRAESLERLLETLREG
jgi:AAA+ ATPase superfamily predicted ATPase